MKKYSKLLTMLNELEALVSAGVSADVLVVKREAIVTYAQKQVSKAKMQAGDGDNIEVVINIYEAPAPIDIEIADHPALSDLPAWTSGDEMYKDLALGSPLDQAIKIILDALYTDGSHHKQWGLEQALRLLTGDHYEQIVKLAVGDPNDDDHYYGEWDKGIAP